MTTYFFSSDGQFPCTSNASILDKNISTITLDSKNNILNESTHFSTAYKPHFKELMDELDSLKFKYFSSVDEGKETPAVLYRSKSFPAIVIVERTIKINKEGLGSWIKWSITVHRVVK